MFPSRVCNFIDGAWRADNRMQLQPVINPATQEVLSSVLLSDREEVDLAVAAAGRAFAEWRQAPAGERVQYLYKLKGLLEEHREELARIITMECGKTLGESRGEIQRAIENVEVACGIPMLLQGTISEDIAPGIDEMMLRQPLGVCAAINPFNFPGMIPFWFFPYAIACGDTFIVKPSERVPLTMQRVFELIDQTGLPAGVMNLVNGGKETVDALLDHPAVRAISFVGSTEVARYVYTRATASGKRAQCQGGAKNPVVILPDADIEMTTRIVADSAFGCAGQRCLAASLAITVGDAAGVFQEAISDAARDRVVGYGLDEAVQMGPVITPVSRERVERLVAQGIEGGARPLVDGRGVRVPGYERGNFIRPTVLDAVSPDSEIARTEIFGPVLGLIHAGTVDEAIRLVNQGRYGNMACIFTASGAAARKFRHEVEAGNVGVNIGVAAPIATFPFSGWKDSFFGDLHGQSMDAVDFFTQKKVVIERWPKEWSRTF
ncbi:MAG TPA: CoA-acylating methylmalonate-semialdehyde dehydrogenase [Anaerolineaceae bacterium]|nr:CoA-acylating methylmalonate-semialdehyde dehydrogenase [Anaerolineaceae bacterium]